MVQVYSPTVVVKVTGLPGLKGQKGEVGAGSLLRLETLMQAGVLTYSLPDIPPQNGVSAFINGIQVTQIIDGVNMTITGYTAGEIENDDELKVYY